MKDKSNPLKLMLLFIPAMLLSGSCSNDRGDGTAGGNGEKEVEITFKTPASHTRAAITEEDDLKDITLLVFDGNTPTSTFLYSRYAWRTSTTENKFRTTLKTGSNLAIYFAANAKDLIQGLESTTQLIEETTTWTAARELLMLNTPTAFDLTAKGLPMWGHKFGVTIAESANNDLNQVNLLRAVASTDITVTTTDFTFEKGHLVYAADRGYLAYDPLLLSGNQVSAPESPAAMTTTIDWYKTVPAADNGTINNYFYMYENDAPLTPTGTKRPTKIIIEGKWTGSGSSGNTTFYPISFRDGNTTLGYTKKQVTRNNKYYIIITKVNGDGWDDIDVAKDADDANMEYEVVEWNDNEDGLIEVVGSKFFYRAACAVELGHKQHSAEYPNTKEIVFRTNYDLSDIKMTFTSGGTGEVGTTSNARFRAETLEEDPDGISSSGDEYTYFRFTALKDYDVDTDNPSILYVTAGLIEFRITVTQNPRTPAPWEDGGDTPTDL